VPPACRYVATRILLLQHAVVGRPKLTRVPPRILSRVFRRQLYLYNNKLVALPEGIFNITNLE
jgi:hypothetical protein